MSIEDIDFLKKNSIKQSYTFLVDSKNRDRRVYPQPGYYAVDFTTPYRNVIGVEIVDVSIPKTMYNIDYNNNKLYYYISKNIEGDNYTSNGVDKIEYNGEFKPDTKIFSILEIPPGDYSTQTFINTFNNIIYDSNINYGLDIDLKLTAVSSPPELTNLIDIYSNNYPFILDMKNSSMSEVLGFDLYTNHNETLLSNDDKKYDYKEYNSLVGFEKLYHSNYKLSIGRHNIRTPGMMYLLGEKYIILRCPEIEEHLYRSLSYTKHTLGLAKFRINSYGYNDEKTSFTKIPFREFHPIGKLSRITLKFETSDGYIYNFKGVNHNIVFAIYYYEPVQMNKEIPKSLLNPQYKHNYLNYLYSQEEQEGESSDDDDGDDENYSRDNINRFKNMELKYNKKGINLNNNNIIYETIKENKLNEKDDEEDDEEDDDD